MAILDRESLEQSPLADLHAIASELSIDGYRRLRKPELIAAILERQDAGDGEAATAQTEEEGEPKGRSRRRGRRRKPADSEPEAEGPKEIADSTHGTEVPSVNGAVVAELTPV